MLRDLDSRLSRCTLEDRASLRRRARRLRRSAATDQHWARLEQALSRSEDLFERRRSSVPAVQVPGSLPIAAHADDIVAAIRKHPVVIVSGDTGSGKSTQIPKLCLLAGRGVAGQIAHTQPRRVAARGVARRLAHELGQPLGESVGFKVRFDAQVRRESHVKVITDGLLLAELGRDRQLRAYDTVIVDEAHERSLNIDFLLGYLKTLCARRPELRVVVSSATLDEERFAAFFDGAPVVKVQGRSWPVTVRHRPPAGDEPLAEQVRAAVDELVGEGPGDVLVFLSGEREIHEVGVRLKSAFGSSLEVLPLYARLPLAKQDRIFAPHATRRVVLATNVAETSLTVPGVRYVVDAGLARIGRYSPGSAVQRLPVEPISQASARQRAGRCGREAPGVCIRLYDEAAFEAFEAFTPPEIRRTDLAAVLLRMRALGVSDIGDFPFMDPPGRRHVNDGLRLLDELGALDGDGALTALGRRLARLPLDPRVGRMLLAAGEHDCVAEVLVIAAGLAAGDPRERERGQRGPLPQHLRFEDERSDFLRLLHIWEHVQRHAGGGRASALAQLCRQRRLSFSRVQEWREIHLQLSLAAREMGLHARRRPAGYARIHRALLAGLLRHVGSRRDEREYQGIRGNGFRISRASGQCERRPRWVLAAEVVDAGGAFAHTVAGIRPEWVERAAGGLIRRSHFDAWWDESRGEPMVNEQTALYALTVTPRRRVRLAPVSEAGAREVFIRNALVEGRMASPAPFLAANAEHVRRRRELEARLRRPDPGISHERLFRFYDEGMPERVWDAAGFEAWWPTAGKACLEALDLSRHGPRAPPAGDVDDAFPPQVSASGMRLRLEYRFAPGEDDDGITVQVPRELLGRLRAGDVEWAVPGLLRDKVEALLRALPKGMRRRIGPAADVAAEFLGAGHGAEESVAEALARFLELRFGVAVGDEAWAPARLDERLAPHLRPRYRVRDDGGPGPAPSRDLERLKRRLVRREAVRDDGCPVHTRWDFGPLAEREPVTRAGSVGWLYPALAATGNGVTVVRVDDRERAEGIHEAGLTRLALRVDEVDPDRLARTVEGRQELCLLNALVPEPPLEQPAAPGGREALMRDLVVAAAEEAYLPPEPFRVRDAGAFDAMRSAGRPRLEPSLVREAELARRCLEAHRRVLGLLGERWPDAWGASLDDAREQLRWLVHEGFVTHTPRQWRPRLPSYLEALELRLGKLRRGGARDGEKLAQVRPVWERFVARARAHRRHGRDDPALARYRWMVEEFRVSLFAQEIGTAERVSRRRLDRLWDTVPP